MENIESCLKDLEHFKDLVTTQWTAELSNLAMKNLITNEADKIPLLPLTEDIMKLKNTKDEKSLKVYNKLPVINTCVVVTILPENFEMRMKILKT